jgi:hypothetical protein
VMDSEIEQLPDLTGYLKFASSERWLRVTLQPPQAAAARDAPAPPAPTPPVQATQATQTASRDCPEAGL